MEEELKKNCSYLHDHVSSLNWKKNVEEMGRFLKWIGLSLRWIPFL